MQDEPAKLSVHGITKTYHIFLMTDSPSGCQALSFQPLGHNQTLHTYFGTKEY